MMPRRQFYDFYAEVEPLISNRRFYEASRKFDSVRDAFQEDAEFQLWYCYVLLASERYEECVTVCKFILDRKVVNQKIYEYLVESLLRIGRSEEAVFYAKQAIEKDLGADNLHLYLLRGLTDIGSLLEARKVAQKIEINFPHLHKVVRISLAAIEALDGNLPEAFQIARDLIDQYPDDAALYFICADYSLMLGQWSEAEQYASLALSFPDAYERLTVAVDTPFTARKLWGTALYLTGRLKEAEKVFRQQVAENSLDEYSVFMLADTLRLLGNIREAEKTIESYIRCCRGREVSVNLLVLYGWIAYLRGDSESAMSILRRAVRQDPTGVADLAHRLPIEGLVAYLLTDQDDTDAKV